MRIGLLLGVVLIGLGAWVVSGKATYSTKRDVLRIGEMEASVQEKRAVPGWVGYLVLAGGVVVLVASARRRPG